MAPLPGSLFTRSKKLFNAQDNNGGNLENISKINGDLNHVEEESKGLAIEVIEAKIWSKMIEDKIPEVVPETINLWEMMAGLENIVQDCKLKREKVVVYFTNLRCVRKTYEDSCDVRVILKSLGVCVDERDVSMRSGFKEELKELIGEGFNGGLPRVFVGGRVEIDVGGNGGACDACGDIIFVPCETCSGSCKVYYEDDETKEEEDENGDGDGDEKGCRRSKPIFTIFVVGNGFTPIAVCRARNLTGNGGLRL
ncbi:homeobox-leucine zipper protein HAT7-like [Hibiscus syriacus]|uniref:Homeobox-leucine zipper protein HAT7-like n=1 Tax=Hibiscus syriacus TaxID=106335 RepID=A0A6A2YFV4_HIBSY|nr:homeobox-leucine zipper protein HAT7-like [Hibiscus syriacus]